MRENERLRLLAALYDRRLSDVASAAGMSLPHLSRFLNGHRTACPEQVRRIEDAIIGRGHPAADERSQARRA